MLHTYSRFSQHNHMDMDMDEWIGHTILTDADDACLLQLLGKSSDSLQYCQNVLSSTLS
jgi:hypothetical protein